MRYAFKDGLIAAQHEGPLGAFFSESIIKVTGGRFSHVEVWLSGPSSAAQCFSAIEPIGCRYATINLREVPGMWAVLETPTTQAEDDFIRGFCAGSEGKPYDAEGIVGIGQGSGIHNPLDRFCSEYATELGQVTKGLFPDVVRWMIAPSGPTQPNGRRGLYEMCLATEWKAVLI